MQSSELAYKIRETYFEELLHKNFGYFADHQSGGLAFQVGGEVDQIAHSFTFEVSSGLRGAGLFLGGLCFLIYTSFTLTCLSLVPILLLLAMARFFGGRMRRARQHQSEVLKKMTSFSQERFAQMKTVKIFNAERSETNQFKDMQRSYLEVRLRLARYSAEHYSIMEFLGENTIIFALAFGGYLISLNKDMDVGRLTAFALYCAYTGGGAKLLAGSYAEVKKALGLYEKIKATIENSQDKEDVMSLKLKQEGPVSPSVTFEGVSFAYPNQVDTVLRKVSFHINSGEVCGIVGESGAGKSSLFHLLCKLYSPSEGRVLIGTTDVASQPEWWVREHISLVSQEALLFTGTIYDNVSYYDPTASAKEVEDACTRADAMEFISRLPQGLNTEVGESGYSLSGGQRQRICIARALLKRPQIFLLDEATSGIDGYSEQLIQEIIEREVRTGYTALVITHRVSALKDFTDKILLVHKGQVIDSGKFEDVKNNPAFKKLYSA